MAYTELGAGLRIHKSCHPFTLDEVRTNGMKLQPVRLNFVAVSGVCRYSNRVTTRLQLDPNRQVGMEIAVGTESRKQNVRHRLEYRAVNTCQQSHRTKAKWPQPRPVSPRVGSDFQCLEPDVLHIYGKTLQPDFGVRHDVLEDLAVSLRHFLDGRSIQDVRIEPHVSDQPIVELEHR
jgi:hypothetical protein